MEIISKIGDLLLGLLLFSVGCLVVILPGVSPAVRFLVILLLVALVAIFWAARGTRKEIVSGSNRKIVALLLAVILGITGVFMSFDDLRGGWLLLLALGLFAEALGIRNWNHK